MMGFMLAVIRFCTLEVFLAFDAWFFFFQAEDGIRDLIVTGVQTCALPISIRRRDSNAADSIRCLLKIFESNLPHSNRVAESRACGSELLLIGRDADRVVAEARDRKSVV